MTPAHESHARSGQLKQRFTAGAKKFIAIFLYLYVVLGLLNLHEYVVLKQHNLAFAHFGWALINALVMAKVMLIAEELHFGRRWEDRPLIYPVLAKSLIFAVVLIAFHVAEDILTGLWHGKTFAQSVPGMGGGGITGVVIVAVIASVSLVPFFAVHEMTGTIGSRQLYTLIFLRGRRDIIIEVKAQLRMSAGDGAAPSE